MKRIVSTFLLVLMLIGSFALTVSAAAEAVEDATATKPVYEFNTNKTTPTLDYLTGQYKLSADSEAFETISSQEQKLNTMDMRLEQNDLRLYVDEYSGEVAVENIATGDVMFSNPYNVSSNLNLTAEQKAEYLSQIIISYKDTSNNNQPGTYTSFQHAAHGGAELTKANETTSQISVKYIKNGILVEYAIGRMDTRYLVPERISQKHFEEDILATAIANGCSAGDERNLKNFFKLLDVEEHVKKFESNPEKAEEERENFLKLHPEAKKGPVYEFTGKTKKEYKAIEGIIKKFCPDYSYEDLDAEHLSLNYVPDDKNEALFHIALEYTLNEDGFSVRLPANGLRFDESIYRLEKIEILPFMGAAMNPNSGYNFFPDGSGALFDYEELAKRNASTFFYGEVYGDDFAFYELGEIRPHNEVVRYPVFGLKEDVTDATGNERSRGYLAIVEEGDSMLELCSYHSPQYNSLRMSANPRPYDQYELSDAISVAGDAVWTVVSPRKYTGSFKIRYIMLTDPDVASGEGYFEPSYVGMAKAYRNYLEKNGVLTRLTADDVKENIPLYIETFGAIETTEKFLSVPYDTMKALTSFGDIRKMYDELSGVGIDNINFVLTGYTKGGLNIDQVPYHLNWDGAVEKEMKFEELVEYANEKGFGVYPDFDFVFASTNKMFDGLTLKDHAVMTIDGRYTSKREYSATRQAFVSYFELAMSPAYFNRFYEKLSKNYLKYDPIGISVSTLGSYLNSDFDEDEPYNREDSKEFTTEAFAYLSDTYKNVMTSGGNVYSWKYVDYITDIATDSSRHARSSATVPFLGIVLHGYVQTAGEPINMEGNVDYALLRSVENGASLKFILSYRNTEKLKEYTDTNMYYSVRYDIWLSDLVARYNEINALLKGVQLSTIEQHIFLDGQRIPDNDEILGDAQLELNNAIDAEIKDALEESNNYRDTLLNIRKNLLDLEAKLPLLVDAAAPEYIMARYTNETLLPLSTLQTAIKNLKSRENALAKAEEKLAAEKTEKTYMDYKNAKDLHTKALTDLSAAYDAYMLAANKILDEGNNYLAMYELSDENFHMLAEAGDPEAEIAKLEPIRESLRDDYAALKTIMETMEADVKAQVTEIETQYAKELGLVKEDDNTEKFDKYAAANNSIVYEAYENGTSFILNFNNYAVKVMYNDVYYTVDAYSYVVLS